ncbi:MAG TPA: FecR domain-containing protein [Chloroflexi bacterium]|nr:FecR domain-containing protein [Chloroflexota bacterium]
MRKNPERTAWIVLLLSFFIFCALTVSIPLSIRWYVINAYTPLTSTLTSVRGTVLVKRLREDQPVPVTRGITHDLDELGVITTDSTSQATLALFDESIVTLYNNTTLIVQKTGRPRFALSPEPEHIHLEIVKGRIRADVAPTGGVNRVFTIKSPHAEAALTPGSYAIEVSNERSQLTSRAGEAAVSAQGQTIIVPENERTIVSLDQPPSETSAAEQNLIVNGNFSQGLNSTWKATAFVPANTITETQQVATFEDDKFLIKVDAHKIITTSLHIITRDNRSTLEFKSEGVDNIHTEASVQQNMNKDVQDFRSLRIAADIRLDNQSLPGGGQIGTEFPLMIHLAYRDAEGNDRNWYHGFYYAPPPGNYILYNEADNSSESINQFLWYPYESQNLLTTLGPAKPVYIKYIRVYASGWIYDTMVTDIQLLTQD